MSQDQRARLLVVEDDPSIRAMLGFFLVDTYDLELVGRFDHALHAAAQGGFDLFLLDINLGEPRTGIDLLGALRQMPAYAATPAVACTSNTEPGSKEHLLASGFDAYIGKPFTEEELLDTLHTVLAASRLSRHIESDRQSMPEEVFLE